jgi:hypothetical protein
MEERLKLATTQFKVMDVDIGKETDNRAEIITKGMAAIKEKVRSDMQEEWTKLAEGVDVAPLVRKTAKPTGKDHYSAPLLFTVQDKAKRWRMEEILRNSKIYPGFHWPQEMMTVLKDYKTVLKDNGVNDCKSVAPHPLLEYRRAPMILGLQRRPVYFLSPWGFNLWDPSQQHDEVVHHPHHLTE